MGTKLLEVLLQEVEVVRAHHRAEVPLLEVVRHRQGILLAHSQARKAVLAHRQAEVLHLKVVLAVRQVQALLVARHRAEVLHLEVHLVRAVRQELLLQKIFLQEKLIIQLTLKQWNIPQQKITKRKSGVLCLLLILMDKK